MAEIWSCLHRKFRVAKYSQLPRTQSEAILYVTQMQLRTAPPLPDPSPDDACIDPRALMLTGQSEPLAALTREHHALIDAHAWVLAGEAHALLREHITRRIAFQILPARIARIAAAVEQIVFGVTWASRGQRAGTHPSHRAAPASHAGEFTRDDAARMLESTTATLMHLA